MPGGLMPDDSDSDDELPPGWEERATNDGYVYYMNHQSKSTQWTHPRTGKSKQISGDLPPGWRQEQVSNAAGDGSSSLAIASPSTTNNADNTTTTTVFIDGNNADRRTYADPRLAFAVEDRPRNVSEVRQRFDASTTALQVLHGRDLSGRVAIVTGANTGIGYETARSLAQHGCQVVLACRRREAGEAARVRMASTAAAAAGRCRVAELDLADMRSVRTFVEAMRSEFDHIYMLILNAATFAPPYSRTVDGLELTFQVCHLAHHYIATRLGDRFDQRSRVVVVASESHRFASLTPDDTAETTSSLTEAQLSPPPSRYWAMRAYNNAKLCNVLFARELGRRWQLRGIAAYSLHPGNMVSSDLSRHWWVYRWLFALVRPFTKSLQQAAATTVYCVTANEITGISGQYYNNCFLCEPSKASQSQPLATALWDLSEEMIERIFAQHSS